MKANKMKVNVEKLKSLIQSKFNGNYSNFAEIIGIGRTHMCKILKTGANSGNLFFGGFLVYCQNNGLDFNEYVFLPESVKKINGGEVGDSQNKV